MKTQTLIACIGLGLTVGCATIPKELVDARKAYAHASDDPAAQKAGPELREAKDALDQAEKSNEKHEKSSNTKDLAYVAQRKAQLAEEREAIVTVGDQSKNAGQQMAATAGEVIQKNKAENAAMLLELAKSASVKEEPRGLVISLSGSVLFAFGKAELLPSAQSRLNDVADSLIKNGERKLVVEGHTDSVGSSSSNMTLSQHRADAVKSYLVSRGYSADLIEARGIGKDRPIADNKSLEGRANNRRVEIIVLPEEQK